MSGRLRSTSAVPRLGRAFRRAGRRAAGRVGFHIARKENYDLVRRDYYSPVPDFDRLPSDVWDQRTALCGIDFDPGRQIEFAERELGDGIRELQAPKTSGVGGFFFENGTYEYGDAEVAYAMVRRFRPDRILELGSGFSTLALGMAAAANGREGRVPSLLANDPFPQGIVGPCAIGVRGCSSRAAQDIPLSEFRELRRNDILFVDTTHVVKIGGDVNYIVLEVLPLLAPGVLVHFHDIWLPDEYHRALTEHLDMHWTEQYLLQAFLAFNAGFEVLLANHAVARYESERFETLVPGYTGQNYPSGFWLRRVGPEG